MTHASFIDWKREKNKGVKNKKKKKKVALQITR
jgi:hypothetical protein